jgi:3-isopropylmalate/(R)-2-methylmalate dehydratase large subunit
MTQKILANKANKEFVKEGEFIEANLDIVLGNDITGPVAIKEFEKINKEIFDKNKIALIPDHFAPNKDIKSAMQCKVLREFAKKHNIKNYFEVGKMGIEHALLPEQGIVTIGDVIIGADSHTCTYGALGAFSTGVGSTDMAVGMANGKAWFKVPKAIKFNLYNKPSKFISGKDIILHIIGKIKVDGARYMSMEFSGEGLKYLSMDDRFTISNMAIEAGAKNGIFEVDEKTLDYVNKRSKKDFKIFKADDDYEYFKIYDIDLSKINPTVSCPSSPDNTKEVKQIKNKKIDQVVIGSCTNGRLEDMKIAAKILKNNKVNENVRLIIIPATQEIYKECIKRGYIEIFIDANAVVSTPTCGPCLGGHMGILAENEVCLATTNRNFVGRMGHINSKIYLSSPLIAAYSAIKGYIDCPSKEEFDV